MTRISKHKPRDYQVDADDALRYNRKLLIPPTASGKSLMIYLLLDILQREIKRLLQLFLQRLWLNRCLRTSQDYVDGMQRITATASTLVVRRRMSSL